MQFDPEFKDQFQSIRCFDDSEVTTILAELKQSERLIYVFSKLFPGEDIDTSALYKCRSIAAIQEWLVNALVPKISGSFTRLEVRGIEALDPTQRYLFISNHRDIAMDPLLVNVALYQNGFDTAHNAIGDNLLLSATGTRMALLNKCFRVARSVRSPKAMLVAMKTQAEYIRRLRLDQSQNVWIAQREGRALDGHDLTNPALIKMLTLGLERSEHEPTLNALNIVPVSISYEWDPCDVSKAKRVLGEDQLTTEQKLANDKLDILKGLIGFKGAITITFGQTLDLGSAFSSSEQHSNPQDAIAQMIDRSIYKLYSVYPVNTLAKKLLTHPNYTPDSEVEANAFKTLCERLPEDFDQRAPSKLATQMLRAYAMPSQLTEQT